MKFSIDAKTKEAIAFMLIDAAIFAAILRLLLFSGADAGALTTLPMLLILRFLLDGGTAKSGGIARNEYVADFFEERARQEEKTGHSKPPTLRARRTVRKSE